MALHVAVDYHAVEDVHRGEQRRRADKAGHPPLPTRLMAGLAILKSMHLVIVDTTVQPKAVAFPTDASSCTGRGATGQACEEQGLARHHASSLKWRLVHRSFEGDAGKPLRRPYFGDRPARD